MIEALPYGLALVRDGKYVCVNAAWAEHLGRDRDAHTGRPLLDDVHEGDRPTMQAWLAPDCCARKEGAEFRFLVDGGKTIALEIHPVDAEGIDGATHAFVSRDITELRKLQASLLLADRMQSVGALAAGVAHEINNPLAYVVGNLSFIEEAFSDLVKNVSEEDAEDLKAALEEASEGASRVSKIVNNLLTFSRADQESRTLISINSAIESAIAMAWPEIRPRARLEKQLENVPPVHVNESRLAQVILNLLINAAHALPIGKADEHEIRIKTYADDRGHVVIELSDTGPGIPPELLGHVFDTFFTTKPIGVGTGLGLSIARSIVEEIGGKITVASELGKGATFHVYLPASVEDRETVDPDTGDIIFVRGRVIIIDDEPYVARMLGRTLRDHVLWIVAGGKDAIELLGDENVTPDLILCDLFMPDRSGADVFEWIESNRPDLSEAVVFLTGGAHQAWASEFLASIDNYQIQKPFDANAVRDFVNAQVAARRKPTLTSSASDT